MDLTLGREGILTKSTFVIFVNFVVRPSRWRFTTKSTKDTKSEKVEKDPNHGLGLSPEAGSAARQPFGSMKNGEEWPPSPRAATEEKKKWISVGAGADRAKAGIKNDEMISEPHADAYRRWRGSRQAWTLASKYQICILTECIRTATLLHDDRDP